MQISKTTSTSSSDKRGLPAPDFVGVESNAGVERTPSDGVAASIPMSPTPVATGECDCCMDVKAAPAIGEDVVADDRWDVERFGEPSESVSIKGA